MKTNLQKNKSNKKKFFFKTREVFKPIHPSFH